MRDINNLRGNPAAEVLIVAEAEEYLRVNYRADLDAVMERSGIDQHILTRLLCRFVCFDRLAKKLPRSRETILTGGLPRTIEQVQNFPQRVRSMADEIRAMNSGALPLNAPPSVSPEFVLLPETLEGYASLLEKQHVSELAEYQRAASTFDANQELRSLVQVIKESKAGMPMWEEITSLVNGTVEALTASYNSQEFQQEGPLYDVATLKMRLSRMKSKSK